jgi:hypothetical protein
VETPHSSSPSSISSSEQRSLAASISVSLPKRPIGAPANETTSAGHAYQLRHLTKGEAKQRAELGIKEASFPSSSIQFIASLQQHQFIRSVHRITSAASVHQISSSDQFSSSSSPEQFTPTLVKLTHHSNQLSGVSRRRKLRPAARPRCLAERVQQHPAELLCGVPTITYT